MGAPAIVSDNVRVGWAEAANDWAAGVLVRMYNAARTSGMPSITYAISAYGHEVSGNPQRPQTLAQPVHPANLRGLRAQARAAARQFGVDVVRVVLINAGTPHAYVEFRTSDPARTARTWGWRPTGVSTSVVLLDNPCGTPIATLGAEPTYGSVWTDPVWFTAGYGTLGGGPLFSSGPPLRPANRCY